MKYMNMLKKYWSMELQLFAGEDDPETTDQKKIRKMIRRMKKTRRIIRTKRNFRRKMQMRQSGNGWRVSAENGSVNSSPKHPETLPTARERPEKIAKKKKRRRKRSQKASKLEVKVACYEADVAKDAVDDVAALARAYMDADDSLDLEDAIEKVVKKYPHFKKSGTTDPESEDPNKGKSWGERQKGGGQKLSGVEAAFLKRTRD